MCALINTEGTVSVQKDDVNPSFKFEARTCAHSGRSDFVVAGAFDPAKSAEIDAMIESLSPVSGASPPPTGAGATATMASQAARFLLVER